jgi:ubiquinone/menaquinone biosynthesis C-methylase UbiE
MSINDKSGNLQEQVSKVAEAWTDSPYYDDAEKYSHMFWQEGRIFKRLFGTLDLTNVLELSCGHGRHAEKVALMADRLTCVDIISANIEFCRNRLRNFKNVNFVKGNGYRFPDIPNDSMSAIYCYDSMVHFTPDIVESYLKDTRRVLAHGGRALFHHSNFPAPMDRHYGQNPHARNHMTKELFGRYAHDAGLVVLESTIIDWGDAKNIDCVSLLEKKERA